ncbi:MAG TPA: carboxypeptidase-like regulatory domain-containing protein, partial [Polyangia bacterium]
MRRVLVAVIAFLLALLVVLLLRRYGPIDHRPPPTVADLGGGGGGAAARVRPAPPLRLPTATAVEDAKVAAGAFGGRVLATADGQPIARASLTFLHEGAAISTQSDGNGRFVVEAASPGAYELTSAVATGFLPFEPQLGHSPVTVQARAGVRLDDVTIYLSRALALDVLVVDDKNQPLPGAEVRAFDDRAGPASAKPV